MKASRVATVPTGEEFLSWLFEGCEGSVLIRRIGAGGKTTKRESADPANVVLPEMDTTGNWYFGVCTREPNDPTARRVLNAPAVWADLDNLEELPDFMQLVSPSAVVSSGHGFHLYWRLTEPAKPDSLLPLLKYAVTAIGADAQSAETKRLLRIPGTINVKSKPHVDCVALHMDVKSDGYSAEEVADLLMSAVLASEYGEGARNELVMGFAATMARNGVSEERCQAMVSRVADHTGDAEKRSRLLAIQQTYGKYEKGEPVSTRGFADAVGEGYAATIKLLGAATGGGDLVLDGEVVGAVATLEQDLVTMFVGPLCRWSWAEGQPMVWDGLCWVPLELKTLNYHIFSVMDKMTTVSAASGEVKRLPAKTKVAESVARMVLGKLAENPMSEHEAHHLGLVNGTLDLITGDFRPSLKEDRIRKLMPVAYDEAAKAPIWTRFIEEATADGGEFLQEWLGYCLRLGNPHERMLWVYGPSGTGKSTFLITVYKFFGPLVASLSSQNISQYQIASLADARVAMCTELSTYKFRTGIFKSLVSGDPVSARHPYGRPFPVTFNGKFIWASNTLPVLDELEGVRRRLVLVPFEKVPKRKNEELKHKLMDELPGILNWAFVGLRKVDSLTARKKPWAVPNASSKMVGMYDNYQDLVGIFLEQEMEAGPGFEAPVLEVFQRYSVFARQLGAPFNEFGMWFIEEMRRRRVECDGMLAKGIRFKNDQRSRLGWGVEREGR